MFSKTYTAKQKRSAAWITSLSLHISGAALLATFGTSMLAPPAQHHVTKLFLQPATLDTRQQPAPLPKPKLRAFKVPSFPKPVETARQLNLPEAPVIRTTPEPPATRPLATIQPPAPTAQPVPPPQIKTGVLDAPQITAAPPARPAPPVHSAGFSQMTPGEPNPRAALTIQAAGFDQGPTASAQNEPKRVASLGGFAGLSATPGVPGRAGRAMVSDGSFGDTVMASPQQATPRMPATQAADSNPVEITFKPRPAYTEEARRRQIEGEVVLQAIFAASGEVRVLRVVRGLGYGLDESAMAATHAIRFRPAKQNGRLVDTTATLRMSFELAY